MNNPIKGRWPIFLRPKPQESLLSWICRLSVANRAKVRQLLGDTLDISPHSVTRTFDDNVSEKDLILLAQRVGLQAKTLWQHSTNFLIRRLNNPGAMRPRHLLLNGISYNKSQRYSNQFCALCLREKPYFKMHWRLSAVTVCDKHGVKLLDRCPQCEMPVDILANDAKRQSVAYSGSLVVCGVCGFDLSRSSVEHCSRSLLNFSKGLVDAVYSGHFYYSDSHWTYAQSLFLVVRSLAFVLMTAGIFKSLVSRRREFDVLEHRVRYELLETIALGFLDYPRSMVEVCESHGIRPFMFTGLHESNGSLPFWFDEQVVRQLEAKRIGPSEAEIIAAIQVMLTRGHKVNRYSLNRFMGYNDSGVINKVALKYYRQK